MQFWQALLAVGVKGGYLGFCRIGLFMIGVGGKEARL